MLIVALLSLLRGKRDQDPELKPQGRDEGASLSSVESVNPGAVIDLLELKPTGSPAEEKNLSFCSR